MPVSVPLLGHIEAGIYHKARLYLESHSAKGNATEVGRSKFRGAFFVIISRRVSASGSLK
jgi:hypothetical protein